ncbi:conserved hypothetical protein [Denitrovibrio acetiphilus DSM 12809]|uniref:Vitamin K epoxide reductase n=1 Tax=Denitrovibrio acetiphilus (strain DSM 12809 / NBRC 114555 / N2460) TaxID=522772 RepID=D4H7D6_DENA2|nr:hypothetical protein [Denitrovibrio acetiphilus]ADD67935.1 conserved hypothetical protein [Denitrovibrio acetiphilus DSM 12809]
MGLLIPEVFILLLTDSLFMLLLLYTAPFALRILTGWDISASTPSQYHLEKRRYLISTIVSYIFLFKIPLFLFFIYTNDKMSNVLTGAMCAAGSINATVYGSPLLYFKIVNIFLMSAWLTVYKCNNTYANLPYTKNKYGYLLLITVFVCIETSLAFLNFASIDPTAVVSCCSSIYSATSEGYSLIMSLDPFSAFVAFVVITVLYIAALILKRPWFILFFSVVFFFAGTLNLILFTSTYVYELPSHRCPYCILQKEYSYVGYIFYISLFISSVSGICSFIFKKLMGYSSIFYIVNSIVFALIYFVVSVFYPIRYFFINNTWL